MNEHQELTQNQSLGEQGEAERLSLGQKPPSEVPGYRLEKQIGAGAFGQVWSAIDLNTGRRVAIKFYLQQSRVNWDLLSREVKNLVALSADRYIVQVLQVGWDAQPPYYVMEYIQTGSLEDLLRSQKRLSVNRSVTLFREIAEGLNRCHQRGILHCDLKPANILLDEDLYPRLADFGQSRMTRDQTPALGTLFYMAPEQADLNATADARWDVYSLGALLYRMLTGNAPHRGTDAMQQLDTDVSLPKRLALYREKITEYGVPLEHRQVPGVDKRLASIIERCLQPVAEKRFQNVQQVLQALASRDKALAKRPMMLLGVVGPLLLLATTCFLSWRMMGEARDQTTGALRKAALEQCRFAAKWVASGIETDLRAYFQTIEMESKDEKLVAAIASYKKSPPPGIDEVPLGRSAQVSADTAAVLQENPAAKEISVVLQQQLKRYGARQSWEEHRPVLATLFVTDHRGTIIAVAYSEDSGPYQSSLGGNYAYRSYFHGGAEDLPLPLTGTAPTPVRNTHLSAPFSSLATGLWKVAVSTPIRLSETSEGVPDFLFVATINLGEFRLLDKTAESQSEFAVLIDARPQEFGTILQHPLMDRRMATTGSFGTERFMVAAKDLRPLLRDGLLDYRDPMALAPGGDPYLGSWIATAQRVSLPLGSSEDVTEPREESNLAVLVQYKLERVLQPVGVMMETLLLLGSVTIGSILVVMAGLWYFVTRFYEDR